MDEGAYVLKHGRRRRDEVEHSSPRSRRRNATPPDEETARPPEQSDHSSRVQSAHEAETSARRSASEETIPLPDSVRKPHPAVREIIDHKTRLSVPAEQQRRALIILHALATEAIRRGWTVTANPSTSQQDPWNGRRTRMSPGPDLFWVDAGHQPAAIRLRMKQKRIAHVPTQKERDDEVRLRWRGYPKYDYVTTDIMRLEIRAGSYSVFNLEDAASKPIEDKLLRAVHAVEKLSTDALKAAERHREIELERLERQRQAEDLRRRSARYTNWFDTLEQLRLDAARHRDLPEAVGQLRQTAQKREPHHDDTVALTDYLNWAEEHLEQSDPFRTLQLPEGQRPDMNFTQWTEWKQQQQTRG